MFAVKKDRCILPWLLVLLAFSCGGYTKEQEKAAATFCGCMEKNLHDDFDINFYECDATLRAAHPDASLTDEGWALALEETCPSIAGKIAESVHE